MSNPAADQGFLGPLSKIYQSHLVPLIFQPYATDLGNRLAGRPVSRVLEIAALRNEIEARAGGRIGEATDRATDAIARRFGKGEVEGKIQAHVVAIER